MTKEKEKEKSTVQPVDLTDYNTITSQLPEDDDTKHTTNVFPTRQHSSYKQGYDHEELQKIKSHMHTSAK